MRRNATTRKMPTPAATVRISTWSGTAGVWLASTCRSGSAMVTMAPIRKQHPTISHSFFDLVNARPTCSPMGIMAMSAPSVKKPMPMIKNTAPTRNSIRVDSSIGAMVMPSASTISVTGSTELRDSCIFALSFLFILAAFLFRRGRDRLRRSGRARPRRVGRAAAPGMFLRTIGAPSAGNRLPFWRGARPNGKRFPPTGYPAPSKAPEWFGAPAAPARCGCCAAVRRRLLQGVSEGSPAPGASGSPLY